MKTTPFALFFISLLSILFCSFALAPPQKPSTPSSTQQQLLYKKKRLQQRFNKATKPQQKLRLKKRFQLLQGKIPSPPNSSFEAIFCFATGTTSIVLLVISALANSIIGGPVLFGIAFGLATLLGLVALILGIIYHNKRFKDPQNHPQPALAVLGMVFGGITFLVGILLLLTFVVNLF
ncbi:MAG: hypothetical protein ACRBFS_12420 [Aureispira sp.]